MDANLDLLRTWLPKGSTVYTVLAHVSRSGMQRSIVVICAPTGTPINISSHVADAVGWKWADRDAVIIKGCGMDMGFYLVHTLAAALYDGDGRALKQQWL